MAETVDETIESLENQIDQLERENASLRNQVDDSRDRVNVLEGAIKEIGWHVEQADV